MRFLYGLGVVLALCGPAAAATLSDAAISGVPGWDVSQTGTPPNSQVAALAADPSERGHLPRPKSTRLLILSKGGDRAGVLYLEYATDREAKRALNLLRQRLLGGEGQPSGPRLLRATNVVVVVDARTLSVTMTVSQQLGTVGSVQDGADASDFEDVGGSSDPGMPKQQQEDDGTSEPLMGTVPQVGTVPSAVSAAEPALQAQVAGALGKYLQISAEAGQLLQGKKYREALVVYRRYQKQVDADKAAQPMARWDAASGVGMAAAYSGQMAEARKAFQRAVGPAARLDPRKLAETLFNLACAEAELGAKPAAVNALRACMAAAKQAGPDAVSHYQQSIRSDHSLRSLQSMPQLRQILAGK